ncbi:MAG: class I SAM-dependent methyltransferase [Candidatus Geothermincolia bacterium]
MDATARPGPDPVARRNRGGGNVSPDAHINAGTPIRWARAYDFGTRFMYLGRGKSFRRRLLDLAMLKDGEGFLDVGCGPGRLVVDACHRVGSLGAAYGVDLSPQMVKLARNKAKKDCPAAEFQQAMAQRLPFDDGFFDAIVTSFVMHHMPDDFERRLAFREMHRVLRKGGRLVVVDFAVPKGRGPAARGLDHHLKDGDTRRYPSMMRQAGFARIDTGVVALRYPRFVRGYAQ